MLTAAQTRGAPRHSTESAPSGASLPQDAGPLRLCAGEWLPSRRIQMKAEK